MRLYPNGSRSLDGPLIPGTYVLRRQSSSGNPPIVGAPRSYPFKQGYAQTVSTKTPEFKTLKRSALPENPYWAWAKQSTVLQCTLESGPVDRQNDGSYSWWAYTGGAAVDAYGSPEPMSLYLPSDSELWSLNQKALTSLKNQKINLGVALGELSATGSLLRNGIGGLVRHLLLNAGRSPVTLSSLLKANGTLSDYATSDSFKAVARRSLNDVSSNWLRYSYGVRPLVNDIYGAAETLADSPQFLDRNNVSVSLKTSNAFADQVRGWQYEFTRSCILRSKFFFEVENPLLYRFSSLGLTNPAAIAWELVPYSFVLDWFLPIGSALSNLDSHLGLRFVKGSRSYLVKVRGYSSEHSGRNQWSTVEASSWSIAKKRELLSGFPSAYALPRLRLPTAFTQAASFSALLVQSLQRKR